MRRAVFPAVVLIVVVSATPAPASDIAVGDLLVDPAAYDQSVVGEITLRGELIGDFGRRRGGTVWTQLNGDPYADAPLHGGGELAGGNLGIGVRIPGELAEGLDDPGGYRRRGPVVEVVGFWHYHDPDRGGESWLEVTRLRVVEPAVDIPEDLRWGVLVAGTVLIAAAAGLFVALRRRNSTR